MKPALYEQVGFSDAVLYCQASISNAVLYCQASKFAIKLITGNIIIRKYSLVVCSRSNMITKATYKFEYYITIKSNFNIFTHIDKTNAVKNEIYKFTLPHRYILIPDQFKLKPPLYIGSYIFPNEAWEIAFAKIRKRVPYSRKMLPTCFTFDNIHTMKYQQLYIGRNISLSVN